MLIECHSLFSSYSYHSPIIKASALVYIMIQLWECAISELLLRYLKSGQIHVFNIHDDFIIAGRYMVLI